MGFMDKVKAATQDVAQQAKKATSSTQSKLEEGKLRKKADEVAKNLGWEIYRERAQNQPAPNADAYVNEIKELDGQIAEIQQQAAAAAAVPTPEAPVEQSAPASAPPPAETTAQPPSPSEPAP